MANKPTTRQMSDAHEKFLASLIDGLRMPGSGNQWARQTDARNKRYDMPFPFAVDGKSTLGKSVGVTQEMWEKVVEQANGERPMLALRWYSDWRLTVAQDLVVIDAADFRELLEAARAHREMDGLWDEKPE